MSLFTPWTGILGGSLIGGSAGVLLIMNGDIMGISGIMNNSLVRGPKSLKDPEHHWRWIYLSSFCLSVHVFVNYVSPPDLALADARSRAPDVPIPSTVAHVLGGLLVGFGTRLGNGCTTGHGICGMSRLSPRSLVATVTFTGCAMVTTYLISPLRSWAPALHFLRAAQLPTVSPLVGALVMATTCLACLVVSPDDAADNEQDDNDAPKKYDRRQAVTTAARKRMGAALSGGMFAVGLAFSGMAKKSKVHDFLCFTGLLNDTFDPTLVTVLGSGILASWASYQYVADWTMTQSPEKSLACPAALPKGCTFSVPKNTQIDAQLISGAAMFGVGWGLTGVCPGPALFLAASGVVVVLVAWLPSFVVGSLAGQEFKEWLMTSKKNKVD